MPDEYTHAQVKAFVQAVQTLVGTAVPVQLWPGCRWHKQRTERHETRLQNWIGERMPEWMSAIGIIEAAEHLVESAMEVDEREFLRRFGGGL